MRFLERTFQLSKGVGPYREKDLWARGLATWDDFEGYARHQVVMNERLDRELLGGIARARAALAAKDLPGLAGLVPAREHWRLYGDFAEEAAFFDIEADGDHVPTVVGVMDRHGLVSFRRGLDLERLPARLGASRIWVTFNGSVFDVPALERHFGTLARPVVHLDLRFLVRNAKVEGGGLKGLEARLGLARPPHLLGLKGLDAIRLWREWTENGRLDALRLLTEYNLYDAINLRSVLEWTVWRMAELHAWPGVERSPIFERGDVLYDLSRLVLALP